MEKIERTSEELIREIESSNLPSYMKKIEIDIVKRYYPNGRISYRLQPYEVDGDLWLRLCRECHPTIGLFVGFAKQKPKRIPLYLNGRPISF